MKFMSSVHAYWRYYAGFCDKIQGESFPEDGDGRIKMTQYMPYGVCAGIGSYKPKDAAAVANMVCSGLERHTSDRV